MAPLYINGTSGISGVDGSAATPALQGSDTNTGISFGSDVIIASTGGVERTRIDSSGYLRLSIDSPGIQFGGDTAATNALDDYEEGTYTVQLFDAITGGNASATTATGHYTKVGRLVTLSISINNFSTVGMTGTNAIHFSLPFASAASATDVFDCRRRR